MELWDSIRTAPIWLMAILSIMAFASFYTALHVLSPVARWLLKKLLEAGRWYRRRIDDIHWWRYRPSVELIEGPSGIIARDQSEDVQHLYSSFKIKVSNRDYFDTEVRLSYAKMSVKQKCRRRTRETTLDFDQSQRERFIILKPRGDVNSTREVEVSLKVILVHDDIRWAIRSNESYKWEIYDIRVHLDTLGRRDLHSFKGGHEPT